MATPSPTQVRRFLRRPSRLTPAKRVGYLLRLYEVHDFLEREILVTQRKLTDRQLARLLER